MTRASILTRALLAVFSVACAGTTPAPTQTGKRPPSAVIAPNSDPFEGTAPPDQREQPPPAGPSPDWSFPPVQHADLANGLELRVVERRALPVVELELVIRTGSAADRDKPGLGAIAGELLKAGGAGTWTSRSLLDHAETLGSSIEIVTDRDSTRISMAVTRDHFQGALDVIGTIATKPRLDAVEFTKLKRREMDRVTSLGHTSAGWAASMVLYRELYELPTAVHPYSRYDSTSSQIDKIILEDCRRWHHANVTPKNAFLVVAGDVSAAEVRDAASKTFADWKGEKPEALTFNQPLLSQDLEIFLVDRPESPQAEVYLATLGPERRSDEWPAIRAANQILGGGVAGRLFMDVREKRSLAYRTNSNIEPVANGPVPIVLTAGTQTSKAGLALQALLEHFQTIGKSPPSADEVAVATRYLSDIFLLSVDTVGALTDLTANLGIFGLADDYYDTYRAAVRNLTAPQINAVAGRYFRDRRVVAVVAGDAKRLGKPLSHFGPVMIVDPDKEFVTRQKIPQDPTAPIELERVKGT